LKSNFLLNLEVFLIQSWTHSLILEIIIFVIMKCSWLLSFLSSSVIIKTLWINLDSSWSLLLHLGIHISLKISEEKKKEGENQGRGASVMHLWCFHDQFRECSSPFFVCSSLFVDLQPVSFQFRNFEFIRCTLRGPFLLCMFSSSSRLLSVFFFFILSKFRLII